MRNSLLLILTALVLLASCKKNEPSSPAGPTNLQDEKRYQVKFNVGVFSQSVEDFPKMNIGGKPGKLMAEADGAGQRKLKDYMSALEYDLFDSQGSKIASGVQRADTLAGDFKLPNPSLKPGKYRVVFLGVKWKKTSNYFFYSSLSRWDSQARIHNYSDEEVTDMFFSTVEFEVGNADSTVEVNMIRPGGKLKIVVEDEWPANVGSIKVAMNGMMTYYLARDEVYQSVSNDLPVGKNYSTGAESVNGVPVPVSTFIDCSREDFILTSSNLPVIINGRITAFGLNNDVIATKELSNIRVERNKITTVKGKLFNDLESDNKSSFKMTIDTVLAGEINQSF